MKNLMKQLLIICFGMILSIIGANIVHAEDFSNGPSFSVKAVLPNNQKQNIGSYFALDVEKGQKQTLDVQLSNSSDQSITILQSISSATTNQNGLIVYSPNDVEPDKTLKIGFDELATGEKKITLAPHEKK